MNIEFFEVTRQTGKTRLGDSGGGRCALLKMNTVSSPCSLATRAHPWHKRRRDLGPGWLGQAELRKTGGRVLGVGWGAKSAVSNFGTFCGLGVAGRVREREGKAARAVKREAPPLRWVGWTWTRIFGMEASQALGMRVSVQMIGAGVRVGRGQRRRNPEAAGS